MTGPRSDSSVLIRACSSARRVGLILSRFPPVGPGPIQRRGIARTIGSSPLNPSLPHQPQQEFAEESERHGDRQTPGKLRLFPRWGARAMGLDAASLSIGLPASCGEDWAKPRAPERDASTDVSTPAARAANGRPRSRRQDLRATTSVSVLGLELQRLQPCFELCGRRRAFFELWVEPIRASVIDVIVPVVFSNAPLRT